MNFKLGRNRPVARGLRLRLKDYIDPAVLPAPPASTSYSQTPEAQAVLSQVFLNDQLGDCVIAAGYHILGMLTANAGNPFVATSDQLVKDYGAIGGYVPGDESTDQGCDEETALNHWANHGFANGSKPLWLELDPSNPTEMKQALWLFENLFFGVELPDTWISPFPSAPGFDWANGQPDPQNGHAFCGVDYNDQGVQVCTWGMVGTVNWDAVEALCSVRDGGQLFTLLLPDQVAKATGKSPGGVDWATLQGDFKALQPRGGLLGK